VANASDQDAEVRPRNTLNSSGWRLNDATIRSLDQQFARLFNGNIKRLFELDVDAPASVDDFLRPIEILVATLQRPIVRRTGGDVTNIADFVSDFNLLYVPLFISYEPLFP